jgi:hypothetical protein
MTDCTTPAPACPRLAAPGATHPRGTCHSALSPSGVRPLASTIHGQAATRAAHSII